MNMHVSRQRPHGKQNQRRIDKKNRESADIVDPLTKLKASNRRSGNSNNNEPNDAERSNPAIRKPRSRRADQVSKLRGNGIQNSGSDDDSVDPNVPRRHKATQIPKRRPRPNVKSAFERHLTVQAHDRRRHRQIKHQHGSHPHHSLRAPETSRNPHPRTTDDAQNLCQNEIAQAQPPVKRMGTELRCCFGLGQSHGWDSRTKSSNPSNLFYQRKIPGRTFKDQDYTYAWTAVSKVPFLTTLALWPKGDCWHGGDLFLEEMGARTTPANKVGKNPSFLVPSLTRSWCRLNGTCP